jgi:phage tail-like protein
VWSSDPLPTYNFSVEIEGLQVLRCSGLSGLERRIDVLPHAEGGVNDHVHNLPGPERHTNLVLRHGLLVGSLLFDWFEETAAGRITRRNGTVLVHDATQRAVRGWDFRAGLPVRWTGPELDAADDRVGFETVEIAHEGLRRSAVSVAGG